MHTENKTVVLDDVSPVLLRTCPKCPPPILGPVEVYTADRQKKPTESPVSVVHGRGLVATRDVQPGECLFVINPVTFANITDVHKQWNCGNGDYSLEEIAEKTLLGEMKQCLGLAEENVTNKHVSTAASLMIMMGNDDNEQHFEKKCTLDTLLGRVTKKKNGKNKISLSDKKWWKKPVEEDALLSIIRRNAFGPDFHNYDTIEESWNKSNQQTYRRILGLYPLAAMINHSCISNAVRVFSGETMVVHANAPISSNQEILWSYIPPAQPYQDRQKQISSKYGFNCCCERCRKEALAYDQEIDLKNRLIGFHDLNQGNLFNTSSNRRHLGKIEFAVQIHKMEEILKDPLLSNEAQRYLRIGFMNFYLNYFNLTLLYLKEQNNDPDIVKSSRTELLTLATKLHFAFVSCHNASTEHLSILHLCYEVIGVTHSSSEDKQKSMLKVRFWTEQLKVAHMVRYGKLGHDLEHIREVMKHSRGVLRHLDGLQKSRWSFI